MAEWIREHGGRIMHIPALFHVATSGAMRKGVEGREKPEEQIHLIKLCCIGGILLKVRDVMKISKPMDGTSYQQKGVIASIHIR